MSAHRKHDEMGHEMRQKSSHSSALIYGDALSECLKRAYAGAAGQDDGKEFDDLFGKLDDITITS